MCTVNQVRSITTTKNRNKKEQIGIINPKKNKNKKNEKKKKKKKKGLVKLMVIDVTLGCLWEHLEDGVSLRLR